MSKKLKVHDGDTLGKVFEVKLKHPKPRVATMSDMKCPFCQQELDKFGYYFGATPIFLCNNCNLFGGLKLWQELIRTRKALDVKERQVEISKKALSFINENWDNADCGRKELGACAFNAKEDIAGWESDVETALEQKDIK